MRTTTLPGTELTTTRLGFGTAALMARLGRRESVRLLEQAHDSGIGHFDTARAYGYGEAESALGEFLSCHRDGVTVTTKLGMVPPRRSPGLRAAKAVARVVAASTPALRARLRQRAQTAVQSGRFSPDEARASLETSLRELRLECVDILLLHECRPADLETAGLLELLQTLVREGKVRHFGIATDADSTRVILAEKPEFAPIVQLAHNPLELTLAELPALGGRPTITHSAMRVLVARLADAMSDAGLRRSWSDELGVDCSRRDVLGSLLVSYGLESNPGGVVLFSSTDPARIRSNAALVDGPGFSSGQARRFAELAREAVRPPMQARATA